jgi:ribonuclease P protein component
LKGDIPGMLKKKHRLAKDSAVKTALKTGRGFFNPDLSVKFLPSTVSRFTVVVSTKVDKRAVKRNRLKRIFREYIKQKFLGLRPGDYVIMLKPVAAKKPEAEVLKNFHDSLLNKWKLLKK